MVRTRIMVATATLITLATVLSPNTIEKSDKSIVEHVATVNVKVYAMVKQTPEQEHWNVPVSSDLQTYIHKLCLQYGVDEQLAYAVMKTESNFDSSKVSTTSDYGLFQINSINFAMLEKNIGFKDPLNSFDSSKAGIYMLSQLQKQFANQNEVLMAYNGGYGMAKQLISRGIGLTDYVIKVQCNMRTIKKVGDSDRKDEGSRRVSSRMVEESRKPNMYLH